MRIDSQAAEAVLLPLKRLRVLNLLGTPISPAAVACVVRGLPGLELYVDD